ncbi:unnamed protein product [Parascedosporium putredinis]|uniref:Serine/threonine-protein kinase SSN3 n=1 Tax=Parascedosporium putredinis TaxID=1442378 RepID=A0A9P1GXP6_9PEZI|nr:unnamed protein product [Parascedosporium putredinis]CAI7989946.1 unnamed protein product [Parascedosporium putredinis]
MGHTNPPTGASCPGSVPGSRSQTLKHSVQAVFEGNMRTSSHLTQNRLTGSAVDRGHGHIAYQPKVRVTDKYKVVGFISSGTYGRVYKALARGGKPGEFAIKKFKPDKEGEQVTYTGISQSAIREMSLCTELRHENVIKLVEIMLEDKCIFMSIMFQLLNGCQYLHTNWVLHRDLKPANIMVTSAGEVKIGDLGLARRFDKPLHSLFSGDKVVVTIWYRAPELILGSQHYTPAIDMWAVGCIFAELLSLRPIFKGEEAKMDSKKTEQWPLLAAMPEYLQLRTLHTITQGQTSSFAGLANSTSPLASLSAEGYDLLSGLLEYDPEKRLTAAQALEHTFFSSGDRLVASCFEGLPNEYPRRRVTQDDDIRTSSLPGTKRSGLADDSLVRPGKRVKEA